MADVAQLVESVASIAWPAIIVLLIFLFRPAVAALIESARSRKFTLRLGAQELTMEEASQQQQTLIADLQSQILEIRKQIEAGGEPLTVVPEWSKGTASTPTKSILWVDDQPKNNSYFVQQLSEKGVAVDLAMSTADGLRSFDNKGYGAVISDLGRTEDGTYKETAGLELLQKIRVRDKNIPFIIFCSSRGARKHREEAIALGSTAITSSPTEMSGILRATTGDNEA